jgi:hypothetical protein
MARRIRAVLGLEAGVTRGALPEPTSADGHSAGGVSPENMIWIFGTGRTGSTWLAAMMEEPEGHEVWFEPRVGTIFDPQRFQRHGGKHFILASQYKDVWLRSIRNFILDGANARFPELAGGYLAVKEPGGSVGSGLIMEALPESGMVLLIRGMLWPPGSTPPGRVAGRPGAGAKGAVARSRSPRRSRTLS